jgi:hypothetical protein
MTARHVGRGEERGRWVARRWRSVNAALVLASLTCLVPDAASACSKNPVRTQADRADAFILGRASADTVLAGAGSVVFRVAPGHSGPAADRQIFALAIDVERVAGPAKRLLPTGVSRVLMVPWDYGADCQPTPYARSVRWVPAGTRGMYTASLRPKAAWVGGVPTLDVFAPELEPYPGGEMQQAAMRRAQADSALGVDDMLELMDRLPDPEAMRRAPVDASARLYAWVRARPARARMYPVNRILSSVRADARRSALATVHHPAIGTYRLTLAIDGRAPVTIFARTVATPDGGTYSHRTVPSADPMVVQPWDVYNYLTFVAASEAALPTGCAAYYSHVEAESYLYLLSDAPVITRGIAVYPVWIESTAFTRAYPSDSTLTPLDTLASDPFSPWYERREPVRLIGTIAMASGGRASFSQVETLRDGRRMSVSGERLSAQPIVCSERH